MVQEALRDLNTESDIIMTAGMVNIMEHSYFRSRGPGREVMAGNDWHLAGWHSASFGRRDFWSMKNWLGFTSPSLFYPTRRSYKQYNNFVTVAAQFLSADGMYWREKMQQNLWNDNLSALTLARPALTSNDGVQGICQIQFRYIYIFFPWSCCDVWGK